MSIAKRTYRVLFFALLLAVYGAFFSVQVFFNFEGIAGRSGYSLHSSACSLHNYSAGLHGAKPVSPAKAAFSKRPPANSSSGVSFRLNKRFQQEEMPPCDPVSIVAPVRYVDLGACGYYPDAFLPSVTPVNKSLRGPPFAAC
jgi:hypothetical protein